MINISRELTMIVTNTPSLRITGQTKELIQPYSVRRYCFNYHHVKSAIDPSSDILRVPYLEASAGFHVWKLVLQSHFLRTDTNGTWHKCNEQIDEDLTAPFSADRVKSTNDSFDSKLTGAGNPLVRQLGGITLTDR